MPMVEPRQIKVAVPQGAKAGETITVTIPGPTPGSTKKVTVTVPPNAKEIVFDHPSWITARSKINAAAKKAALAKKKLADAEYRVTVP